MQSVSVSNIETSTTDIPGAEGIGIVKDDRLFIGAEDGWVYLASPNAEISPHVELPGPPL